MALDLTPMEVLQRDRLKLVMKVIGIDRQHFADMVERKLGYINQMLSGNRRVTEFVVLRLCKAHPDINPDFILKGANEMYLKQVPTPGDRSIQDFMKELWPIERLVEVNRLMTEMEEMKRRVWALEDEVRRLKGGGTH